MRTAAIPPSAVLVSALFLVGCTHHSPQNAPVAQTPHVTVRDDTTFREIPGPFRVYALTDGDLHGQLRVSRKPAPASPELLLSAWSGAGPENLGPDAAVPIQQRMQLFATLFQRFQQDGGPGRTFGLQVYGFQEFDRRLTCLAARDADWDRAEGQPAKAEAGYRYYEQLLQKGDAAKEVLDTLRTLGYGVSFSGGLENLRIIPVNAFSPQQRTGLCTAAQDRDLLPVRISVTFTATELSH